MSGNELIPSLAMMTLLLVLAFAVIGLALFWRKRSNRHPMDKSPDGEIVRRTPPPR